MVIDDSSSEAMCRVRVLNAVDQLTDLVYSFKTWTLEPHPVFVHPCLKDQQISLLPGSGDTHV